jgi:hypothetical protein
MKQQDGFTDATQLFVGKCSMRPAGQDLHDVFQLWIDNRQLGDVSVM